MRWLWWDAPGTIEGLGGLNLWLIRRARMSLFGSTSGFGTGGTSMFGSTTADNHNPMKVRVLAPCAAACVNLSQQGLLIHSIEVIRAQFTVFKSCSVSL